MLIIRYDIFFDAFCRIFARARKLPFRVNTTMLEAGTLLPLNGAAGDSPTPPVLPTFSAVAYARYGLSFAGHRASAAY